MTIQLSLYLRKEIQHGKQHVKNHHRNNRPADVKKLERGPQKKHPELGRHGFAIFQRKIPKPFFETAHTMLENENSAYYDLIYNAINHIETEHLIKFGMNLGYNSFTWGAQHIRTNENVLGFNIPWVIFFQMDQPECLEHLNQYHEAIKEGEELGIYSWMLFTQANSIENSSTGAGTP